MDKVFQRGYFQLGKQQIALLRFLLESYDGLVFLRTLDNRLALVELAWPPSRAVDALALIAALEQELGMQPAPVPAEIPPL
ncbi:MAG: DUF4911 domain-containing protein [Trichloromonadaceae bacterium]